MRRKQILLVDDNEHERTILSRYLEFVGGAPLEDASGADALSIAQERRPDLILLDLRMPGMDGWETIRRLKADPRTALIPVIALTATRADPKELARLGFCGHLHKPVSPFQVMREVERCAGPLRPRTISAPQRPRPLSAIV